MKVYVYHVRACGLCLIPGAKNWAEAHGFDWRDFIRNGIDIELMEATGDALAKRVTEHVRREACNGR